jgi:SprT protein
MASPKGDPVFRQRALTRCETSLRRLCKRWSEPRLSELAVELNPRLSRSAARCLPAKNVIQLSAAVLASTANVRREILCHEAAHAVVWARHGLKAKPHGPEWQALMRQAGFEPRASLIRCGHRAQRNAGTRFRHTCPVCHFSRTAKRRMTSWRCPECRTTGLEGGLRIERIASKR